MTTILVLGGTAEAVQLARNLAAKPDFDVIYSLAGRTRSPILPDCAINGGGFGGVEGLIAYITANQISSIVDATHPFAAQMAANARDATATTKIPLFKFQRPAWEQPANNPWLHAATATDAAEIISGRFGRVFLSSGLGDIASFTHLSDTWFLVRSVDASDAPGDLAKYHHIISRGPFNLDAEITLLRDWKIEALVSKNSGGDATFAKLEAAQLVGIPIIMIDRPPESSGKMYSDPVIIINEITKYFRQFS